MADKTYTLKIERGCDRWQDFSYTASDDRDTVITALLAIGEVEFECSCLQKKCGACAVVVNSRPMLACDARLIEVADKKSVIRVTPLKKFPGVRDLIVDRSIMRENLKTIRGWLDAEAVHRDRYYGLSYDSSRCMQCGICLEVCPNFCAGSKFMGTASAAVLTRLLSELPVEERGLLEKNFREHVYAGCGKSLACRDICPAGIDVDGMLAASVAMAVWKRG